MSTKRERSNRDAGDSKRGGNDNAKSGQNDNQTRKPAHSADARKIPSKSGGEDKQSRDARNTATD